MVLVTFHRETGRSIADSRHFHGDEGPFFSSELKVFALQKISSLWVSGFKVKTYMTRQKLWKTTELHHQYIPVLSEGKECFYHSSDTTLPDICPEIMGVSISFKTSSAKITTLKQSHRVLKHVRVVLLMTPRELSFPKRKRYPMLVGGRPRDVVSYGLGSSVNVLRS